MSIDIFFRSGKWHIEIVYPDARGSKVHPRTFATYQEAAAVAALVPEWMGR